MDNVENYYEILGVNPDATFDKIKKAWLDKSWIFAEDRMEGAPESAKKKAVEEHKKINRAFETLRDNRVEYDKKLKEWTEANRNTPRNANSATYTKPKPILEPTYIKFKNVKAGEVKEASFLIFNAGGHYSRVRINSSESWLIITDYQSLTPTDELPLRVNIQALATNWNTTYSGSIKIELDEVKAILPVELKTRMKLQIKDHKWHDMDYDNIRDWVKTSQNKAKLDAGEELPGKIFRYRLNRSTGKYQVRLRYSHSTGVYETP